MNQGINSYRESVLSNPVAARQRFLTAAALRYTILELDSPASRTGRLGRKMRIRQATLDDTHQIVALFAAKIPVWQRFNAEGHVEDLPYEALTIYERWLHGGAWMALETGAIWLNHLLSGNGLAWVVDDEGRILAYAEAFVNRELTPMNTHLHLAQIMVGDSGPEEVHHLLADAVLKDARGPGRLSVAYPDYDEVHARYYRTYFGAKESFRLTRYALSAQIGQSFYKSQDYDKSDANVIEGWAMAAGRLTSPRAMWESEWVEHWRGIPPILERSKHRQYVNASGHEALVCFHQQQYNERVADVLCWSPRHLSTQLLVAIRDMGHRLGFRSLTFAIPDFSAKLLPEDSAPEPNQQVIATVNV